MVYRNIPSVKGKWKKKEGRWHYEPIKGSNFRYDFGDYFGMGMSKSEITKYERLHDLEIKARNKGLTTKEKNRFKELSNWEESKPI